MKPKTKSRFMVAVGLTLLAGLSWLAFIFFRAIWRELVSVSPELAVGALMAAATVIAATVTVMFGRYFERKRDIEAHFRAEKIKIYDEFLSELFKLWGSDADEAVSDELVNFLRDWQRKLVLWGGSNVLSTYFAWMNRLKSGEPDAEAVFLMDDFFRALRSDIGHDSKKLPRGAFSNLILRHAEFFLLQAEQNPDISLAELAELEKKHFPDSETS